MKLNKNNNNPINHEKNINELKSLSLDISESNNIGLNSDILEYSNIIYTLFVNHYNFLVDNKTFYNRDRLIIGKVDIEPVLYAAYFLSGAEGDIKDLENLEYLEENYNYFKKIPDALSYSVGASIGEAHISSLLNINSVSYKIYGICQFNALSNGINIESARFAGENKLNNLIIITVGDSSVKELYESLGFNVYSALNEHDSIDKALNDAKKSDKPSLIIIDKLNIDFDIKNISEIKNKLGVRDIKFAISNDVMEDIQYLINEREKNLEKNFKDSIASLTPESSLILKSLILTNKRVSSSNIVFIPNDGASTLDNSNKLLESYIKNSNNLIFASTNLKEYGSISDSQIFNSNNYKGATINLENNLYSSGFIINGLTESGLRPVLETNAKTARYFIPAVCYARHVSLPVIYILVNDKDDNQDISYLRETTDIDMFTPFDANEVIGSFKAVMNKEEEVSVILVTREESKISESSSINDTARGAYILLNERLSFDGTIICSSSSVNLAVSVREILFSRGLDYRIVSCPNIKRFLKQSEEYKDKVLPVEKRKIIIENSNSTYWNRVVFNNKYILNYKDFKTFSYDAKKFADKIEKLK